jgi:hypothetical protein
MPCFVNKSVIATSTAYRSSGLPNCPMTSVFSLGAISCAIEKFAQTEKNNKNRVFFI